MAIFTLSVKMVFYIDFGRRGSFKVDQTKVRELAEIAIMGALAMAMSYIPFDIGVSFGVQFGVIPICLISLRRGVRVGMTTAFIWGILYLVTGKASILSPLQFIIEYFVAFMFCGLTGIVRQSIQSAYSHKNIGSTLKYMGIGSFIGIASQYFVHFIAGVVYWGQYAPVGQSAIFYSGTMNAASGFSTWIACVLILGIVLRTNPDLLKVKKS